MLISLAGKGGVGKTTIAAILIDELLRNNGYQGKILAVDADPAMTLSMALDVIPPAWTLADVRDKTPVNACQIKALPPGTSPSRIIHDKLVSSGVIAQRQLQDGTAFDLLIMGHSEGPDCYCRINRALSQALASIKTMYDLIIVDNVAGMEWLSRYRLSQIDLFLIVLTAGHASWSVANRIIEVADMLDLEIGQIWLLFNRIQSRGAKSAGQRTILLPECETISALDRQGGPLLAIRDDHPMRQALRPLIERIGPYA
jgi:CO dehydrogenase maturation factor